MRRAPYGEKHELPNKVVARLCRIDSNSDSLRSRTSYEFDALGANISPARHIEEMGRRKSFGAGIEAVRILTTARKFAKIADTEPQVGDWFVISLTQKKPKRGLPAWRSPLTSEGFVELTRGWADEIDKVTDDRERDEPIRPLGANVSDLYNWARQICAASTFPVGAIKSKADIKNLLSSVPQPQRVSVRDVGQASYSCLRGKGGDVVLYYDVGWPLPFNRRTEPKTFFVDRARAPIVISHWDWDHLCYALKSAGNHFSLCDWIAPVQKLGPGAARIAHVLHNRGRLNAWSNGSITLKFGVLGYCNANPSNSNSSGLALQVYTQSKSTVLLVGDADYHHLPTSLSASIDGLVITHHGARFNSPTNRIPKPSTTAAKCIVSYGRGNTYKHPNASALQMHASEGWSKIETTAGKKGRRRSDKHFV